MQFEKPKFEIIEQPLNGYDFVNEAGKKQALLTAVFKQIEMAGRICASSEHNIKEHSEIEFVSRMMKLGHNAVLEHGTIYLTLPEFSSLYVKPFDKLDMVERYKKNHYSRVVYNEDTKNFYITTNFRVIYENDWTEDLKFIDVPSYHHRRVSVRFDCDRVTGESFLRHRTIDETHIGPNEVALRREEEDDINSFNRQSTRYCKYSRKLFGGELTIIYPHLLYEADIEKEYAKWNGDALKGICEKIATGKEDELSEFDIWLFANEAAQWSYMNLIKKEWPAEISRTVLPFDIKSPLFMTGYVEDWKHFFDLRCDEAAHPQARELAIPLKKIFEQKGWI